MGALNRKFITHHEAVPTARQHKKPCADCPFARTALNGWLGKLSIDEWLQTVHGEGMIDCHCTTNQQCAGAAIFRGNVCKLPHNKKILVLPSDHKLVFSWDDQFRKHHSERPFLSNKK